MDISLEKYTEELLKGYCEKKTKTKKNYNKNKYLINKYSTNVLEDHTPDSLKECKIRDSDPLLNMTDPIAKTREDYQNILGDIIEVECKLVDTSNTLSPNIKELINFSNKKLLEFSRNPIESVENCNFIVKVKDSQEDIDFNKSAMYSLFTSLYDNLRTLIPIRICQNISELRILYDSIIHVISSGDSSYIECKLSEYMFQTAEGNRVCLTNNREKIINTSKFILDLYNKFCVDEIGKPYIEELRTFIDSNLYKNKYNSISPLDSENYYYLSNPGDGDCLFVAVSKYLCLISNTDRVYPNNKILKNIGKDLRYETCKYMYENRYKIINEEGTIETNTESLIWLLNSRKGETNNDVFNNLMRCLSIKRNKSKFKNPTDISLDDLLKKFNRGEIDDFTKYCILMAQYSMASEYFLLQNSEKLQLSYYAGKCEIACIALLLNKNIVCAATSTKAEDLSFTYNIGTKYSYIHKYNIHDNVELDILIYLRGYKTKRGGASSDHFEMIWPKSKGKPTGVNTPRELTKKQKPLFDFNLVNVEKLIPNYDSSPEISIQIPPYNLDNYILDTIGDDYIEECNSIVLIHWSDMAKKLSPNMDTLEDPHFIEQDKVLFSENDKIKIDKYQYTVSYISKFTPILEKGYANREELQSLIENIKQTSQLDVSKPIEIKITDPDEEGNIKPLYTNFRKKTDLKAIIKSKDISRYKKPVETSGDDLVSTQSQEVINLINEDEWFIFGKYYYKKENIIKPLKLKTVSSKKIIKALKKLRLHKQPNPIRVLENWGGGSYQNKYIYSVYTDDDAEDLENDILHGLLKKIETPDTKKEPKEIEEDPEESVVEEETLEEESKEIIPDKTLGQLVKIKGHEKDIKSKDPSTELQKACKKKTRKDGGLYKASFRNSLIDYVKTYYTSQSKILQEIRKIKKMKHRSQLEAYCQEIDIL